MAISIPLVTTFDSKGITKAIQQFKKLDGGVAKSGYAIGSLNRASTNAFKSIAKVGLGVAVGAGFIAKGLLEQAYEAKKVTAQTNAIITATGGSARISAKGVADLSDALSKQIGVDDELIQKSANLLLTFKQVQNQTGEGNDIFSRAVTTAQDLGNVFGSAEAGAMQLGKALSNPVSGITALRRAGINFTDQQKEQIKTMVESGDLLGAQKLILAEVESQVGGTAKASATGFDRMKVALENASETLGNLLLPYFEQFADFVTATIVPIVEQFATAVGENGLGGGFSFLSGKMLDFIGNLEGAGALVYFLVAGFVALKVAMVAYTVAQSLATIAVALFGVAWNATGIGLVISLIALVIVALIALTIKFKGFRDFFIALWNGIVDAFQKYINIFLGVWEFLINKIIDGVNLIIRSWNRVQWGTDVKEIDEVSFSLDILGAKIDTATNKVKKLENGIGGMGQEWMALSGKTFTPPDTDKFSGASKTVKTMAEKFADLIAELQGYGKQLQAVKEAHRAVLQAPKDLAIAIANTAKAQTHFNNVVNGFSKSSKEAREATRNLAQAQRDAIRAGIGLADAQQAVAEAQKALTLLQTPASARSVAEAQDAITQATYNLADANKELERAQRRNNPRELALAQIAQRDATNALADAQTTLTTLQADADPQAVTDAQETLTQAQLDLAEAKLADKDATKDVKTAQDALNEIIDGAKKGTDAYTEALDLLNEAKSAEVTATDAVTASVIAEKDAKLALAKAERELIMSKKGMTPAQIAKAEKQTGVISGNKAVGGSVQAGKSYIVGEMGREMFTPSSNGTITPNNQMSQGSTIIVNVAGSVTSERNLVEAIRIGLINAQKSGKVLVV